MFTLKMSVNRDYMHDNAPVLGLTMDGRVNAHGSQNLEDATENFAGAAVGAKVLLDAPTVHTPGVFEVPPPEPPKVPPTMPEFPNADLYGKTIDQSGKPLPGVQVEISQRVPLTGAQRHNEQPSKAESDATGIVVFRRVRFDMVVLDIRKDAYLLDPTLGHGFRFNPQGNANGLGLSSANPYVWRLWRKQGPPQPLVVDGPIIVQCAVEGAPVPLDLLGRKPAFRAYDTLWAGILPIRAAAKGVLTASGTATAGGMLLPALKFVDLKFSVVRPADDGGANKAYRFSVEAPSGGLVEAPGPFMYMAPDGNYRLKVEWSQERSSRQSGLVGKRLFLKTRDGKIYGYLLLNAGWIGAPVWAAGQKEDLVGFFEIRYVLNPTGLRSLEPDPKRVYGSYAEYLKTEVEK
jgi:hypothetical protein